MAAVADASASSSKHFEGAPHAPAVSFDGIKSSSGGWLDADPSMHAENRARVIGYLAARFGEEVGVPKGATFVFKGGENPCRGRSDHEPIFRQESTFHWLFGAREPDCYGVIQDDGKSIVFAPFLPPDYAIWMGPLKTQAELAEEMGVDEVMWTRDLAEYLHGRQAAAGGVEGALFCMDGVQTDQPAREPLLYSPPFADGSPGPVITPSSRLFEAVIECRAHKTAKEVELLRHNIGVSSEAHWQMMKAARPGMREYQLEAVFKFWSQYVGGTRGQAYTYICGSGPNAAVLHYGHAGAPNDREIQKGELILCDCGNELRCYASDITTTFPSDGKFTDDQKIVYGAVLDALLAVEGQMKEGCDWGHMQEVAYEAILTALKAGGLLQGEVAVMMKANLGSVFMPHGLGHLLGIDTHDCGGYPAWTVGRVTRDAALGKEAPKESGKGLPEEYEAAKRSDLAGHRSLRTRRLLAQGNVITVEPGCYFIDHLLDAALADETKKAFLVPDAIARFRNFGGVRLEDNVLVTKDGIDNFVKVPRTVEDVEKACRGEISSSSDFKIFF